MLVPNFKKDSIPVLAGIFKYPPNTGIDILNIYISSWHWGFKKRLDQPGLGIGSLWKLSSKSGTSTGSNAEYFLVRGRYTHNVGVGIRAGMYLILP